MTNRAEARVRLARWPADARTVHAIRYRVFVEEQCVPVELELDQQDEQATHFLAENPAGTAIGTTRLLPDGQIGRMAVLQEYRGLGVGRSLLTSVLSHLTQSAGSTPYLNAQLSAVGFYRRLGFQTCGPVFIDAGIKHQRMELTG